MQSLHELHHDADTALRFFLVLAVLTLASFVGFVFSGSEIVGVICYIALWACIFALILFGATVSQIDKIERAECPWEEEEFGRDWD